MNCEVYLENINKLPVIQSCLVNTPDELEQIISLQHRNLKQHITAEELQEQGFVTMVHSPAILQQFHALAPSVIVKHNDKVVAYALTVVNEARAIYPPLESMFALFDSLYWKNKPLHTYRFYEMGQICVAKEYRGRGLFDLLYQQHKLTYSPRYDLLITKISTANHRSLKAHARVGFKTIHQYSDEVDNWEVVAWDWC
jgi:GNAT superfamily N-acetyltransferase